MYGEYEPWLMRTLAGEGPDADDKLEPLSEPEVQPEDIRFALIAGLIAGVVVLGALAVSALAGS